MSRCQDARCDAQASGGSDRMSWLGRTGRASLEPSAEACVCGGAKGGKLVVLVDAPMLLGFWDLLQKLTHKAPALRHPTCRRA